MRTYLSITCLFRAQKIKSCEKRDYQIEFCRFYQQMGNLKISHNATADVPRTSPLTASYFCRQIFTVALVTHESGEITKVDKAADFCSSDAKLSRSSNDLSCPCKQSQTSLKNRLD